MKDNLMMQYINLDEGDNTNFNDPFLPPHFKTLIGRPPPGGAPE